MFKILLFFILYSRILTKHPSPQSGQTLDQQVLDLDALTRAPPPNQGAEPPREERSNQTPSPYRQGEINMAEAMAEIEEMDSSSRAGPNLHFQEDWTYQLQDTPLKRLMEPDPRVQTGNGSSTAVSFKSRKINSIVELGNQRLNASEILEENPRKEQITGGDPPWNGAKSWPRAKRPVGD